MPPVAFRNQGDIDSSLSLHLLVTMVFSHIYAFSAGDRSEVKWTHPEAGLWMWVEGEGGRPRTVKSIIRLIIILVTKLYF